MTFIVAALYLVVGSLILWPGKVMAQPITNQQIMDQVRSQMPKSYGPQHFYIPSKDEGILPEVQAYIEVFPKRGERVQGFGKVMVWLHEKKIEFDPNKGNTTVRDPEKNAPELAYVEVSHNRYFPQNTDSIQVWGVRGISHLKHWVFLLAEGKVNAYSHYPGTIPRYYALGKPGITLPPDSNLTFGRDSLRNLIRSCPRAWAEAKKNPLQAVQIFNGATERENASISPASLIHVDIVNGWDPPKEKLNQALEKDPLDELALISRAHSLCKAEKFPEAQKHLDLAQSVDSSYYLLDWAKGYCEEKKGNAPKELGYLYAAIQFSPDNWSERKNSLRRIRELESSLKDTSIYWRVKPSQKPQFEYR